VFSNSVSDKVTKSVPQEKPWEYATVVESLIEGTNACFVCPVHCTKVN